MLLPSLDSPGMRSLCWWCRQCSITAAVRAVPVAQPMSPVPPWAGRCLHVGSPLTPPETLCTAPWVLLWFYRARSFPDAERASDWGLRGNINIFLAADLPRAGKQKIASAQLNSSIPFIKSPPPPPSIFTLPADTLTLVFHNVPLKWQLYGGAEKLLLG